jgi:coenzyme F420-0:L-glutamate ligase/coenzyme F420-1:gamma-L-glutamate ligase
VTTAASDPRRLEIWALAGLPEIEAGDDLAELIARSEPGLRDGDVIVVTSKVVSKAEGRLVPGTRDDHLGDETARVVARRGHTQIVETHHGFVLAAAGIDASNVPDGYVALLPVDPDASAGRIRQRLLQIAGIDVAVVVSDTMGRPWRDGVVDNAIGAAGIAVLSDLRGDRDPAGHVLEATVIAVADELAAAADLAKGKLAATPVAVVRGYPLAHSDADRGARPLVRRSSDDMFRLGTREAKQQVVTDSAPVSSLDNKKIKGRINEDLVVGCVDLVRSASVELSVGDSGRTVTATGDPLQVGYVLGRLMVALAAEDLHATAPEPSSADARFATIHITE